jgi:protein involved in polysaccharide export with SLBB domain
VRGSAKAEIARLPEDRAAGVTAKTIRVPLDSTYLFGAPGVRGGRTEVPLQPHDHVLVLRQPDWGLQRTVVLTGEVRFPGRYSLERRDERLASLVTRAGGLMPNADSSAIMFLRSQGAVGRIGVDLPRALRDRRVVDNLVLQDGDSIHIPPYSGIVTVAGAVNAPMAVAYVRGANLDYYVRAAGGPGRTADMRRAYVSQASGKVESVQRRTMLPDAVPTPGPGSRVVVPERAAGDGSALSRNLPLIASIVGSLVTIVAVLAR